MLLKISSIKKKMKVKPPGQSLYNFFGGELKWLTSAQITDIERIIDKDYETTKKYLIAAKEKIA